MDRCGNQENTAVLDGENRAGTDALSADFHELLDTVNEQLDPISSYQDCMSDRGIDVGSTGKTGATGLSLYLQGRMPTDHLDRDVPNEAWSKYLSLETDALAADRACRADNYFRGLRLLDKPLAEFEERNDAALRGAEAAGIRRSGSGRVPDTGLSRVLRHTTQLPSIRGAPDHRHESALLPGFDHLGSGTHPVR